MKTEDSSFRSEILCDQIILSHYFEAKGYIGPVEIDGKGYLDIKLGKYCHDIFHGSMILFALI